ncbi:unnamed protein product [Prorocentrum cordatum]|uniref:Centrosomal protein POC5 n=1 Tax=Prorocentrum cordatum TaxID=2364126 RepID=A0ABN9SU60_9DINO|nr:unnamed protein product [Polarella glacialis]
MGSDQGSSMGGSDLDSVKDRLKNVEEEKNVLANALEWKEQQWKTQIETAQLEVEEQKRKREAETISFKSQIAELEAAARQALETRPPPPCPLPERRPATLLGLLRCPVRGGAGGGGLQPAFGAHVEGDQRDRRRRGAVVLHAGLQGLHHTADHPRGQSHLGLRAAPREVAVLPRQRALQPAVAPEGDRRPPRMADVGQAVDGPAGFLIRDLGCEAFTSRSRRDVRLRGHSGALPGRAGLRQAAGDPDHPGAPEPPGLRQGRQESAAPRPDEQRPLVALWAQRPPRQGTTRNEP